MTAASFGTKRKCSECGAKFYDLGASEIQCPKCGTAILLVNAEPVVSSPEIVKASHIMPSPKKMAEDLDDEAEELEGIGHLIELEQLDDLEDEDVDHLEEVEDHHEDPSSDVNSDDADDDMFIDELTDAEPYLIEELDEEDFTYYDDDNDREAL